MHMFSSVQEMMRAFSNIKLEAEPGTRRDVPASRSVSQKPWSGQFAGKNKETASKTFKVNSRGAKKCYECNEVEHYAKECPSKTGDKKPAKGKKAATNHKQIGLVEKGLECGNSSTEEDHSDESQSEQEDIFFLPNGGSEGRVTESS